VKLYNTIIVFDVFVVAESPETARAAALEGLRGELAPSEQVATEVTRPNTIRAAWAAQTPFVADDVSDADFKTIYGKTTDAIYALLYTKGTKP
jgi:hypothetical protein